MQGKKITCLFKCEGLKVLSGDCTEINSVVKERCSFRKDDHVVEITGQV